MWAYYNEFDAQAASWLRALIKRGLIADGEVDERSITDVAPSDLHGFTQCHFFAGIGGWSYALRLAGWPDARPVWTGSPPCQPFSTAGKREGAADARNLWPFFVRLIAERKPATLFGEQVAAAIGNGWLDAVFADLESESYACAAAVLPACSVGAPHIRQRLWFVGNAESVEREIQLQPRRPAQESSESRGAGRIGELADTDSNTGGRDGRAIYSSQGSGASSGHSNGRSADGFADGCPADVMADTKNIGHERAGAARGGRRGPANSSVVGNASSARPQGGASEITNGANGQQGGRATGCASPWAELEWLECADGKARPTKPCLFPLADGVPARVGLLRGAGNAIVPQVAAEVIGAFMAIR